MVEELGQVKTLNFLLESNKVMKYNPGRAAFVQGLLLKEVADLRTQRLFNQEFCKFCSRPWNDGFFTLKVRPKPVMGKRIRKLLRKEKEAPQKLTLFEQKLLKFVHMDHGNKLVLTCLSCQKSTTKQMPNYKRNSCKEQEKEEKEDNTTKTKKKKKKDIFVGLKPEAVLKTALLNQNSSPNSNLNTSKKFKKMSERFNLPSSNDQNSKLQLQTSNKKSGIQQTDLARSFQPKNIQNDKNTSDINNSNNNKSRGMSSFFSKQLLEENKKKEIQRKINNLRHNKELRNMMKIEKKKGPQKEKGKKSQERNKNNFVNFLRAFGNPT